MVSDLGKLFIGGISWDTDEERLKDYFSKYGEVVEAVIMRDRTTGRARGFGFIVFSDPLIAERVITDKHMIDGRTVEAKKAVPRDDNQILNRNTSSIHGSPSQGRTKKIFVGGLASTVTDSDFKKYFEQFGNITDVVVMYDHNTQRPRGFGFITYDSEDAVDRVLHKTFHELNGKMVEVKRAVPKELSPGPSRTPLMGYNYGLTRTNNFLNAYAQGYNMNSIGGFGMRMDSRFSPMASGRFGLEPNYGGGSNFGNSPGFGRVLDPYYSNNSNRYSTPIGFGMANTRNDSGISITPNTRSLWGNGGFNSGANPNPASPGPFLGSGGGSFGVSLGNNGPNWGPSQGGGAQLGFSSSSGGDGNYGLGGGGYGRNGGSGSGNGSSFAGSTGGYDGAYGELYRGNSVWRSGTPELDGSGSFGYGLGNIASDIGGYGVTSRQSNRG